MYNGHKNYNAWNVSLWLFNDESLYNAVRYCIKRSRNKEIAAQRLIELLPESTPDGVKYTYTNVRLALREV